MTTSRDAEVIVVGAGPAGAATAWALARGGRDVLLLDRAPVGRPKACAEYVSPDALRQLAAMGVLDAARRAGAAELRGMRIVAPSGAALTGEFGAARGFRGAYDRGLALRRTVLDPLLVRAAEAAGARLCIGAAVTDVVTDGAGRVIGVTQRDGTVRHAALVVGADGLRSTIARRISSGGRYRGPRRVAFVTHYRGVAGLGDYGEMHVARRGYVGLAPVEDGLTNVALVIPAADATRAAAAPEAFVAQWLRTHTTLGARLRDAHAITTVQTTGPFGWRVRRAWAPGAALVGDAAEFYDPFTGEGIHAGLRGAELLAPYAHAVVTARDARDADIALAAYERARRDTFAAKWMVERLIGLSVRYPVLLDRVARGLTSRRDLADTLVGVTGDVVPHATVLRPRFALDLLRAALFAHA
jgi:flavin-dependent dehydrogenase